MTNATCALVAPGERVRIRFADPALPSITGRVQAVAGVGLRVAVERTWQDWHAWAMEAAEHRPTCERGTRTVLSRTLTRLYAEPSRAEQARIAGVGQTGESRILMWEQIASVRVL